MKRVFERDRTAAAVSWILIVLILIVTARAALAGAIGWTFFGLGLVAVLLVPPIAHGDPETMVPWLLTALAALPFAIGVATAPGPIADVAAYVTAATVAVLVVVELDAFSPVEMNRGFAIVFVIVTTMTAAGIWELLQWGWDLIYGTELVESNDAVMRQLIAATGVGVIAGIAFDRYLGRIPGMERFPDELDREDAEERIDDSGEAVSSVLSKVGISEENGQRLTRVLQGVLVAILIFGVVGLDVDIVVSASIGLAATLLPALIGRNWDCQVDPALTLWIAVAVVFHALGTAWFYQTVWGWHNLAHATTGSLVAGIGYTAIRSVEIHTKSVSFPPKFTLVFAVIFVFAVGVAWEILEFTLDQVTVALTGEEMILTQHGLQDTMSDLLANTVGAVVVATAATVYRVRSRTRGARAD